ncbi:MAG TPA: ABC transporter, partial [Lachnospiraceae bacterium]|nr:ABC transporter [Lachnospiraceae bacterium]
MKSNKLFKILSFILVTLIVLSIFVPVVWVFLASVKEKGEFYGSPWTMPAGIYFQNFIDAFKEARMGEYFLNSVIVTILALAINLVISVPAANVISRFEFKGRGVLNTFFMAGLFINVNYIVIPIFLMLVNGDRALAELMPNGFFINNIFVL